MENLSDLPVWYIVFLMAITFHEAAHAFVAMKLGDYTAYYGGQVSLNPIPHVRREPFGAIIIPILSFIMGGWMIGWASAPYDPRWAYTYPKKSALMALAGPAANLFLMFIAAIGIHVGLSAGVFYQPESINITSVVMSDSGATFIALAKLSSIMFSLNLLLFVLNLLPFPPLDGSSVIMLGLNDNTARKYMEFTRNPILYFAGYIVIFNLFRYIYSPLFSVALNLLYPGSNYG